MKKKRKSRQRNPQKTLRNKCARLWSVLVRRRAGNMCEWCGNSKFVQAHHIIGKKYVPLRYRLENGAALCPMCHKWKPGSSAHQNPILISLWLQTKRPAAYEYLCNKGTGNEETLEEAYERLQKENELVAV